MRFRLKSIDFAQRRLWFAFALLAGIVSGADAEAGVMIPWSPNHDLTPNHGLTQAFPSDTGLLPDAGTGAGAQAPAAPAEQAPAQTPSQQPSTILHADAFHSTNGTSAPTNSSGGAASGSSPMMLCSALADQPVACAFRNWRERSPQLPGLPPCELLDPPKTSV